MIALEAGAPSSTGHASQFLVGLLMVGGELDRALDAALREFTRIAGASALPGCTPRTCADYAALFLIERGRWDDVEAMLAPADPRAIAGLARAILAIRRGDDTAADEGLARCHHGQLDRVAPVFAAATSRSPEPSGHGSPATIGRRPEELDRLELVRGVWTNEVGPRPARRPVRLPPQSADPAAIRAEIETSLDAEARPAMLAEINAELAEQHDQVDPDKAAAGWAVAAEAWQAAKRPYDEAYARLRQAEAGFRTADRDAAGPPFVPRSAAFSERSAPCRCCVGRRTSPAGPELPSTSRGHAAQHWTS